MAAALEQLLANAQPRQLTFEERLRLMIQHEITDRDSKRLAQRLRWLKDKLNVLITGPCASARASSPAHSHIWARDASEIAAYASWMDKDGLTEVPGSGPPRKLSRRGWQEFDRLSRKRQSTGRRGFVAMWFGDEIDPAWTDGFKPAIEEARFDAYRMKEDIHSERIDARIVAAIRESRFVVADATGARTAVYYEAGFADGLGEPVIWTCRKDRAEDMSFDTRQYLHILWDDPLRTSNGSSYP
jgi:nucleoside 2-deoxyribosyltransferase